MLDSMSQEVEEAHEVGLELNEPEPLDVLDLPQIHTRPSAKTLLGTLSLLSIEPRSWEVTPALTPRSGTPKSLSGTSTPARRKVRSQGVPQYLTKIVSSALAWIDDDEEKEQIWDAASTRLSERSGRTGMGAITRTFVIPTVSVANKTTGSGEQTSNIHIEIHEPALTEDNLGLKTWASSYVLSRKWLQLRDTLPCLEQMVSSDERRGTMLELGAGTGLVGMAAAATLGVDVLLTDLPEIAANLAENARRNAAVVRSSGGSTRTAVLDWSQPQTIRHMSPSGELHQHEPAIIQEADEVDRTPRFPLIVAADPIYSKDHPKLLAQAIECRLEQSRDARVIVEMPIRSAYAEERADFRQSMLAIGLQLIQEETDIGHDDWSVGKGEELAEVECWMTVWAWKKQP